MNIKVWFQVQKIRKRRKHCEVGMKNQIISTECHLLQIYMFFSFDIVCFCVNFQSCFRRIRKGSNFQERRQTSNHSDRILLSFFLLSIQTQRMDGKHDYSCLESTLVLNLHYSWIYPGPGDLRRNGRSCFSFSPSKQMVRTESSISFSFILSIRDTLS